MFRIEKTFKFPMGHKLSKHKGDCFNIHGHSYVVKVGLVSKGLNDDDMVIDFSLLKAKLKPYFDRLDHAIMINQYDTSLEPVIGKITNKIIKVECDPTAESMSELIYLYLTDILTELKNESGNLSLLIDYVTVFESEGSSATYSEY